MIKNILIAFIFLNGMNTFSQIEKGRKSIGISFGDIYNTKETSEINSSNSTNYSLSTNLNYFVKDNLSFGIKLGYSQSSSIYEVFSDYKQTSISNIPSLGITSSQYKKLTDKFYFLFSENLNYSYTISNNSTVNMLTALESKNTTYQNSFQLNITPSFLYFIKPKLGIKATFGSAYYSYSFRGTKNSGTLYNSNSYGLNLSTSSMSLGLNYYF